MIPTTLTQAIVLLINLIALSLALVIMLNDAKSSINRIFIGNVLLMLIWVNCGHLPRLIGESDPKLALISLRAAWVATPFFFGMLYILALRFTHTETTYRSFSKLVLILTVFSSVLATSKSIIFDLNTADDILKIEYGRFMIVYLGNIFLLIIFTVLPLIRHYKNSSLHEKERLQYFLFGLFIFYSLNIIFNIILPIIYKIYTLYWIGDYSTLIVLVCVFCGITLKRLLDVKHFILETIIICINLIFCIQLFLPKNSDELFKDLLLLLFVVLLSTLAILNIRKGERTRQMLQTVQEQKSRFFADISHEFKTPLTILKGNLDVVTDNMPKAEKEVLLKEFNRINKLTAELVELSKAESGEVKLRFTPVSTKTIFEDIEKEVATLLKAHKVTLKTEFNELPLITADRDKIHRLVLNLVSNAIKYNKPGGKVELITWKEDSDFIFQIKDTGIGISEEDLSQIFERFFRVDKKKSREMGGTGLGLSIVKLMVEVHHGSIDVKSKLGKGTTFTVRLPITQPESPISNSKPQSLDNASE